MRIKLISSDQWGSTDLASDWFIDEFSISDKDYRKNPSSNSLHPTELWILLKSSLIIQIIESFVHFKGSTKNEIHDEEEKGRN